MENIKRNLIKLESLKNSNRNIIEQSIIRSGLITSYIPPLKYYIEVNDNDTDDKDIISFDVIFLDDIKLKEFNRGDNYIDLFKEAPLLDDINNHRFVETNVLPVGLDETLYRFKIDLQDFYITEVEIEKNKMTITAKWYVGVDHKLSFTESVNMEDYLTELTALVTFEHEYKAVRNYLEG